jgi:hypothetical protein
VKRLSVKTAGLISLTAAAGLVLAGGVAANAATPSYEPDSQSVGSITFYDANGNVVTGGSINAPLAAYAVGSSTVRSGDVKAAFLWAQPNPNAITANWNTDQATGFTAYPVATATAPAVVKNASGPVVTGASTDETPAQFQSAFPNTDPSVSGGGCAYSAGNLAGCTNTAYQNLYQVRLVTANSSGAFQTNVYDAADILVNQTAGTWSLVYGTTPTTTTLAASPSPAQTGQTVTLTATETPATGGTVQFVDGTSNIGTPVAVNASGVATTTVSYSAVGSHNLSAIFTPTQATKPYPAGSNPFAFSGSTGTTSLNVTAPVPTTSTALNVQQDGTAGDAATLTATVTPATAPGSVAFTDNGTAIAGTVTQNPQGTYTLSLASGFAAGNHSVVAKFTPTDPTQFQASSSPASNFITSAPLTGACAQTGSQCNATANVDAVVPVGTLSISTPYTSSNVLHLGTLHLVNNNTLLTTSATIAPTAAQGIQVTDTRSGNLPYNVTALCTNLTNPLTPPAGTVNTINAENLGFTAPTKDTTGLTAGAVATFATNLAAANGVAPSDTGSAGLGGTTAHQLVNVNQGLGTFYFGGTFTLNAPTNTSAGTYSGTLSFTVG